MSCIDLIFTDSLSVYEHGTLDVNLSDHEMIYVTRKHITKSKASTSFDGRSYINYNEELFVTKLTEINWNDFYAITDPDIAWDTMKKTFGPLLMKYVQSKLSISNN